MKKNNPKSDILGAAAFLRGVLYLGALLSIGACSVIGLGASDDPEPLREQRIVQDTDSLLVATWGRDSVRVWWGPSEDSDSDGVAETRNFWMGYSPGLAGSEFVLSRRIDSTWSALGRSEMDSYPPVGLGLAFPRSEEMDFRLLVLRGGDTLFHLLPEHALVLRQIPFLASFSQSLLPLPLESE